MPIWFGTNVLMPLDREPMSLGIEACIGVGRYYSFLCERYPEAVAFVVRRVVADSPERSAIPGAFWAGYLWAPVVSTDALVHLREAYRGYAVVIQQDGVLEEDLRDRFFQHIVIGALREVPGFQDMLRWTLSDVFTPRARRSIVSALGTAVRESADEPESSANKAAVSWFRTYWSEHVARWGGEDGTCLAVYHVGI